MFGKKDRGQGEEGQDTRMTPSAWSRREQENDGTWTAFFLDLTQTEERLPSAKPPVGSRENTGSEDASILHTYWIGYWSDIVATYDVALGKIDAELQKVFADRRMSQKAKEACAASAGRHRRALAQRRANYATSLAKAVEEGEAHLRKAVSPHHRALEATIVEHHEIQKPAS